jgi:hypothetical protein
MELPIRGEHRGWLGTTAYGYKDSYFHRLHFLL